MKHSDLNYNTHSDKSMLPLPAHEALQTGLIVAALEGKPASLARGPGVGGPGGVRVYHHDQRRRQKHFIFH